MSLGVGGATCFAMGSNHQTAANHAFREEVKFDPAKQTRVKCTSCGCWANRGDNCPQCKRPTAAVIQRRNNNVKVEPLAPVKRTSVDAGAAKKVKETKKESTDGGHISSGEENNVTEPTKPNPAPRRVSTTTTTAASATQQQQHPDDSHNALKHKFRDEVKYDPAQQTKIKCSKCGCWALKGVPCKLCKNVTSK